MKKNIILMALCGFGLMGCKKEPYIVKSTLHVKESLEVKNDNSQMVRLNTGEYPTDININTSRVKAIVKTADKRNVTFRLKLPKNIKLPTNGTLELTPAQSGQPFQTTVHIKTDVTNSERRYDVESCTTYYTDYECYIAGNPPREYCHTVTRTRWGNRDVEYFVRSYHRQLQAIMTPESGQAVAQIEGARTDSERIYTREGMCF